MRELFLDTNAHLPMGKAAMAAFIECNSSTAGHGHPLAPSKPARAAEAAIEGARRKIATLIGAEHAGQIVFTSTCTQACSWGLNIFRKINKDSKFIYSSPTEHPAVRQALSKYNTKDGDPVTMYFETDANTVIDTSTIMHPASGVACIYVQNEVGVIQPVFDIKNKPLFVDMSQAPGKVKIPNVSKIPNLEVAVFGAHKFGGPSSVGFMYIKNMDAWSGSDTGSRYYMDRVGTPDTCSIVATAAALEDAVSTLDARRAKMISFRDYIEPELEAMGFGVIAKDVDRVPNTTFARVPEGKYSQVILSSLSDKKIHIGMGSACGSVHSGPSQLIRILSRVGDAGNYIRISQFGDYDETDGKVFIETLRKIL